ncbi:MAG: ATP-binding cassette domain-containing protein [Microscillaceae bacterium]|nr:ATP-binding cassette domain-containing protein [Microscillaceae bacterium]MDW8460658.1 ATP-binding cassette domain-containing protein [Cytophagales bacterium]
MSEKLLIQLIQLFGIVARLGGVSKYVNARSIMKRFLVKQLNDDTVADYLMIFDDFAKEKILPYQKRKKNFYEGKKKLLSVRDSILTLKICININQELTETQKVMVVAQILEFMAPAEMLSVHERDFAYTVACMLHLSTKVYEQIEKFVLTRNFFQKYIPNTLVISSSTEPCVNFHYFKPHVQGVFAFLNLEELDTILVKYLGTANYELNSLPIENNQVAIFPVGSTIRGGKNKPIHHSLVTSQYLKGEKTYKPITYVAENLHFRFRDGKLNLQNITIAESSGTLIGIMGPSGSGKTTLLEILNGNKKVQSGKILINGVDISIKKYKFEGVIGYVPQNDLLIDELTVYQNLYYDAKLCFADYSEKQIHELVIKTLKDLGLEEIKDMRVGSSLDKTISGGQRKRLNIALELMRNPAILFLDEPTSGLSSRDSETLMELLKELTRSGKIIFTVIHQPSSDIFKMFDKIYVLDTNGYPVYYGNPLDAIIYFKQITNQLNSDQAECHECGNVNAEQIFDILDTRLVNEYGKLTQKRKITPQQWNELFKKNIPPPVITHASEPIQPTIRVPNRIKQFFIFLQRDFLTKLNNRQYLIINLLQAPILAFLIAYTNRFYFVGKDNTGHYIYADNENIPVYIFISIIISLFVGLTISAEEIVRDRRIFKRESFLHMSRNSYLLSKIVMLFTFALVQSFLVVLVGNTTLQIRGMFWQYWVVLFSAACFANMLGLNISASFNQTVNIYILIPILLIPQIILGGIVVKFDRMNPDVVPKERVPLLGDLMASRWAYEALMVTQFKDNPYERLFYDIDKTIATAQYKKVYYLPNLETQADFCFWNIYSKDVETQSKVKRELELLKNELANEAELHHLQIDNLLNNLSFDKFNENVLHECKQLIKRLSLFYSQQLQYNRASREKILEDLEKTKGKRYIKQLYETYFNDAIARMVKNIEDDNFILESDNRLIQKIYPIYKTPTDIRAHFFAPEKCFFGTYLDTLWYNVFIIWCMNIVLYYTLYFNALKRLLIWLGFREN